MPLRIGAAGSLLHRIVPVSTDLHQDISNLTENKTGWKPEGIFGLDCL